LAGLGGVSTKSPQADFYRWRVMMSLDFIKVDLVIYFTPIAIFRINNFLYHPFVSLNDPHLSEVDN
jgi:hypothetical protein